MNPLDQPLIEACQNGDIHTTQTLLQQGANPNAKDNHGRTPITTAAEYGHLKIITTLIQYGANPHIQGAWKKNRPPLRHPKPPRHHNRIPPHPTETRP